jgi:Chaperone of endosialidase
MDMKKRLVMIFVVLATLCVGIGQVGANPDASNTFIGQSAGNSSTNGIANIFIGYSAGHFNTAGSANVFIGYDAGSANTIGGNNIFIGCKAGGDNTTGDRNIFIGCEAGSENTDGHDNTFSGYQTGIANTTGNNNTFSGDAAGSINSTGSDNTFIGHQAGFQNTTGDRNTFSGADAGLANATGHGNVFLGSQAGYSETGSGKLYIDDCWSGPPCSTPLIYGQFDKQTFTINGSVGIGSGMTTPTHPIQLSGGAYSDGRAWYAASSREYKQNIQALSKANALRVFKALQPVTFRYRAAPAETHVGFIAEDMPAMLAAKDRKGLSALDIVAVLTKVAQAQGQMIDEQKKTLENMARTIAELQTEVQTLKKMGTSSH